MPWIKIDHATPNKPEVLRMARRIGCEPVAVLGACVRIWCWFDAQSHEGKISGIDQFDVDNIAGLPGITAAMIEVGWATIRRKCLQLQNFQRHNGETAKRRAMCAKRVGVHRTCNAPSVTSALPEQEQSKSRARADVLRHQPSQAPRTSRAGRPAGWVASAPALAGGAGSDADALRTLRSLTEAKARLLGTPVSAKARGRAAAALEAIARQGRDPAHLLGDILARAGNATSPGGWILRALEAEAAGTPTHPQTEANVA